KRVELAVSIRDLYALRLRREVLLETLKLSGVDLHVEVNQAGQSNLVGLKTPPPSAPRRIEIDYSRLIGTLDGTFALNDQARRVEVGLTDLKATAAPQLGAGSIALDFATGAGHV